MYHRIAVALVVILIAVPVVAGCSTAKPMVNTSGEQTRKALSAPVNVNFQPGVNSGYVYVTFDAAATDVNINVYGVDGLRVTSVPQPITLATFAKSDTTAFEVTYTPGMNLSHLVVAISGNFNGALRSSTLSYAIGKPSREQLKPVGTPMTDSDGKRIKLMPGE